MQANGLPGKITHFFWLLMPRQYNLGNNVCKICNYNIFYILAMPNTLYKQHKISIFVNVMRLDVPVMRQAYHIIYYLELNLA